MKSVIIFPSTLCFWDLVVTFRNGFIVFAPFYFIDLLDTEAEVFLLSYNMHLFRVCTYFTGTT